MIFEFAPPSGPKFAEGMKYTQKFLAPLVNKILHMESRRILPDMTETHRFYIYTLSRDLEKDGNVVILRSPNCNFFMLKISCNHEYDGFPRIFLSIQSFYGNEDDLVFRGRVWDSGLGLVYNGLNLIDRLSFYFRFKNYSMQFAEKFLTLLGIGYYKCLQDFERVLLMGYGLSAAEIFLDLFFSAPRPNHSQPKVYMMTQIKTHERAFF